MLKDQSSYWQNFIPKTWDFVFQNYNLSLFKHDLIAGITVGIIALPLAMAFAISSGVSPERGLMTAVIAGFIISLFGGSRFQISGPTGAFVVIIYSIIQESGYEWLMMATFLAGILLLIAAFSRLGNLIKYIPYPLVTGFTTGIAVSIFSSQIKDFLGLKIAHLPADFIPKWGAIIAALPTFDMTSFIVASATLILIILIRKFIPVLPWGITAVGLMTLVTWGFELPVQTIMTRFGEIERILPLPSFPTFSHFFSNFHALIQDAVTIAFLAGIESLLSAVVADGMAGTRHRSNCELMGQGIGNLASVFFGGIPATGAIARTAANIKSGGKTPMAGMIHSLTIFMIVLAFAPVVSQISLPALSAILVMVAWNMSEIGHFRHLFRAPLGDIAVLLTTFFLTVMVDLTIAVEVGMVLAAFLFMKRVKDISKIASLAVIEKQAAKIEEKYDVDAIEKKRVPRGVEVYEIDGPFFFGIADSLKNVLSNLEYPPKVFILRMRKVPVADASGMHELSEFYYKCKKEGTTLLLSGVSETLMKSLKKFGVIDLIGEKHIFSHIDLALATATSLVK